MPKIQDYDSIESFDDIKYDNQFITEAPGKATAKISFNNLYQAVWDSIMRKYGHIYEGPGIKLIRDKDYLKMTIQSSQEYNDWYPNRYYYRGDVVTRTDNTNCTVYYVKTYADDNSKDTWEKDKKEWDVLWAPNAMTYTITIEPQEWIKTSTYYYCSKLNAWGINDKASIIVENGNPSSQELQENYNCISNVTINTSSNGLVFYCYTDRPQKTITVRYTVRYLEGHNQAIVVHKTTSQIDDSIIDSTTKSWSSKKIMEIIKSFMNISKVKVTTLPEVGTSGIVYCKLTDDNGVFQCNIKNNKYQEFIWLESEQKYEMIGHSCLTFAHLTKLPDTAGQSDLFYLIKNEENENQYDEYIWNSELNTFEKVNYYNVSPENITESLNWHIAVPTELQYGHNKVFYGGLTGIIYLSRTNTSDPYNMFIWSSQTSEYFMVGQSVSLDNVTEFNMVVGADVLDSYWRFVSGVNGMIYKADYRQLAMWDEPSQQFKVIGTNSVYTTTYKPEVDELPAEPEADCVYYLRPGADSTETLLTCYVYINDSWVVIGKASPKE